MSNHWKIKLLFAAAAMIGLVGAVSTADAGEGESVDGRVAQELPTDADEQLAQAGDAAGDDAAASEDAADDEDDDEVDAEVVEEDAAEEGKSWGVNAGTSLSVGIGSFIPEDEGGRARVRLGFNFGGNYTIPVIDLGVSIGTGFSQWLSRGGGSQTVQEFRWGDTSLGFSRSIYTIPVADISISGSLGFSIPTSRFSRNAGLFTSMSPGLSLGWGLGGLSLGYSFGFNYNFYENTSVTFDPSEVDILSREGGNEVVASDAISSAGVLTEFGISNSINVGYRFLEAFNVGLSWGFSDSWSYDNGSITEDDIFVAENADIGRNHYQSTFGSLSFGYRPLPYLGLGLRLSNAGPWKTADNKGFRFPFFNFEAPQSNSTNLGFSISGNY